MEQKELLSQVLLRRSGSKAEQRVSEHQVVAVLIRPVDIVVVNCKPALVPVPQDVPLYLLVPGQVLPSTGTVSVPCCSHHATLHRFG